MARGIVGECDVRMTKTSRLSAKILVFDRQSSLRTFWRECLGQPDLGTHCKGAVNPLATERLTIDKHGNTVARALMLDPRYFCIIGLIQGYNSKGRGRAMEIVCHEAVHAAYCYEKRRRRDMWTNARDLDEENIAYPTGIIADAINRFMSEHDLY